MRVQDPDAERREAVAGELSERLTALDRHGLLGEPVATIAARVTTTGALADAVADAEHVQECAPERVDLKRELFAELDRLAPDDASLASSSSFLPASAFADEVAGRARCLVAHPGNPPHLLPAVELVPAPFTDPAVVDRLAALLESVGMSPVRLKREVDGFVFNRLQGAVLREAYCLVRDGVIDVEDLDRVVRDGLGRRWAVVGPFETVDLNTRGGIAAHAERMGWTVAPKAMIDAMGNVQSQQTSCPSSVSQYAALAALEGSQACVEEMLGELPKRREFVRQRIASLPNVTCPEMAGAFYAFINIQAHLGRNYGGKRVDNSTQWCQTLLEQESVATVMGSSFGAEGYARISFATSMSILEAGFDAIERFLKSAS